MLSRETICNTLHALRKGVIMLDSGQRVVFWNQWMSDCSGIQESDALDSRLCDILPRIESEQLKLAVRQALTDSHDIETNGENYRLVQISEGSESRKQGQAVARLGTTSKDRLREARAEAIIENIHEAIVSLDAEGRITDLNHAAHKMFGLEDDQVVGEDACILFIDYDKHKAALIAGHEIELKGLRRTSVLFDAAAGMSRIICEGDDRYILIVRDITRQKQAEESLHREKEFAQITLHAIQEAVITTDEKGRVNSANQAACDLLRRDRDQILDRLLVDLLSFSELEHRQAARQGINNTLAYGKSCSMDGQPELKFKNQESIFVHTRIAPLRAKDGRTVGSVAVLEDVTDQKRMQEILSFQATHDDLTSLINRREFERRLDEALATRVGDTHHILLYFDLDQFKLINDNCGHNAGDQMLRQLTSILSTRLRHTDTLARLGGDEFAALLPHCSLEVGRRIADELRELVRGFRFSWGGRNFGVGVSIGLVKLDDSMLSIADALAAADSACYIAKERGRDQVVVYKHDGDEEQLRKGQISQASSIRESLEQERFRIWAQPIVPIHNEEFDWGVEILVRMLDESGKLVPPGLFIPAAERYNLMGHIDGWVVSAVCRHWTEQPQLFDRLDKVAINLSGQSIANDEFLEFLMTEIDNHRIPWHKLCFEVTETAAVSSIEKARHFINTLKQRGARFSLDDFGSGLSSFAYLKELPVDYLKIDGAFVKDMLEDRIDAAMVRSISDVGRAMQLRTIAEFVEDLAVVEALREAKVDYAQGYGICKPMPIEELVDYRPTPLSPTLAEKIG